ncbi:MAG: hypothetical protein HY872_06960 [Chloroflexi bacterium]|nr:hypothetical protein [Chloroflexota bacterium]
MTCRFSRTVRDQKSDASVLVAVEAVNPVGNAGLPAITVAGQLHNTNHRLSNLIKRRRHLGVEQCHRLFSLRLPPNCAAQNIASCYFILRGEQKRVGLRPELDAYYAKLYGLPRDELRYILDPKEVHGDDFPGEPVRVQKEREGRMCGDASRGRGGWRANGVRSMDQWQMAISEVRSRRKEKTPMNAQNLDTEKLLRQVLTSIAELPPIDLLVVYETISELRQKDRAGKIADEILSRAKARAAEMSQLSHAEVVQRFIDATERIRAAAIRKGTAIEGEWESD